MYTKYTTLVSLSLLCSCGILVANVLGSLTMYCSLNYIITLFFAVLKINHESKENVETMMKTVKTFEEILKIWLNTTESPSTTSTVISDFDLKRKRLKEFLSQR